MAKSIRSKVKKRNRADMRKQYGEPHAQQIQAKCTARLQETVQYHSGPGINKLKGLLNKAQAENPLQPEVSKHSHTFKHPYAKPGVAAPAAPATAAAVEAALEGSMEVEEANDGGESPVAAPGVADLEALAEQEAAPAVTHRGNKRVSKVALRTNTKESKLAKKSRSRRKKMVNF
ncbi:hypothetical protein JKP88DRAFT_236536 [Tribonema minus]|uniref:DUF2423 domain-containing protein n=1 Tax=Tribonema minus TaxID=303371 RepID=A0A835Z2D3_9STRA|nr:hypothetical protein JKP88DRAFT_236536 [Tribonema minus]